MKVELMVNWDNCTIETKDKIEGKIAKNILDNPRSFENDLDNYFADLDGREILELLTEENKKKVTEEIAQNIVEFFYESVEIEV